LNRILVLLPFCCLTMLAQDHDAERSRLEITGSYWNTDTSGTIRANGTPVDLKSDLGVKQGQATFTGKLVAKPGRKNKIVVEGTPFRLDGTNLLTRSITYQGQTYSVSDRVVSHAELNYFYAGYQYDFISRTAGHAGFEAGGAYLDASGTITSTTLGTTTTKSQTIGLPLLGAEFRFFPIHKKLQLEFNGEVKGMQLGDYGRYVQASGNVGVGFGLLIFEGGYRSADIEIHSSNQTTVVSPRFNGPVFSVVFRLP
jgi:hypothetical protein